MPTKFVTTVTVLPPRPAVWRRMSTRPRLLRVGPAVTFVAAGATGGPEGSPAVLSFAKGLFANVSSLELGSLMDGRIVAQAGSFEQRQNRVHVSHDTLTAWP